MTGLHRTPGLIVGRGRRLTADWRAVNARRTRRRWLGRIAAILTGRWA